MIILYPFPYAEERGEENVNHFFSSYLLVFIKGGNYWAGNEILQLSLIN